MIISPWACSLLYKHTQVFTQSCNKTVELVNKTVNLPVCCARTETSTVRKNSRKVLLLGIQKNHSFILIKLIASVLMELPKKQQHNSTETWIAAHHSGSSRGPDHSSGPGESMFIITSLNNFQCLRNYNG